MQLRQGKAVAQSSRQLYGTTKNWKNHLKIVLFRPEHALERSSCVYFSRFTCMFCQAAPSSKVMDNSYLLPVITQIIRTNQFCAVHTALWFFLSRFHPQSVCFLPRQHVPHYTANASIVHFGTSRRNAAEEMQLLTFLRLSA